MHLQQPRRKTTR